jgi:hypothetical protein
VAIGLECTPGLSGLTIVYLIEHGEKEHLPGDPGLTPLGRQRQTSRVPGCTAKACTRCTPAQCGGGEDGVPAGYGLGAA